MLTNAVEILLNFGGAPTAVVAYIDPGTTNVIVPAAVGSLGAALLVVKHYWRKITGLGGNNQNEPEDDQDPQQEEEQNPA